MQIIDSCRALAPLRETSVSLERCRLFAFDFAFGVGENAFLRNIAQITILGVEVRIRRTKRYETRIVIKRNGRK